MINKPGLFSTLVLFSFFATACVTGNSGALPEKENTRRDGRPVLVHEGTVREIVVSPGTLSEYRYYVIDTAGKGNKILFNSKSSSAGFERYINKKVRVKGEESAGFAGGQKTKRDGIRVKEITEIK